MNPAQLLLILQAHYKVALGVLLACIVAGIAVSLFQPKLYVTSTSVVFDLKQDPIAGMLFPAAPGYVATQVDIIKGDRVAQKVVRMLKLTESPPLKQMWLNATHGKGSTEVWLGELLQKGLQIKPSTGSNIITISYTAGDPNFATIVANAYAQAYIEASIEMRVDPARQYARWFEEQGKILREKLEKAQAVLSAFQQENGIVAKDEQVDAENTKLNDLFAQLTIVQGETADASSKQKSGADTLPEVMNNPVIANLRSEIGKQEVKLRETAGNLGKNHPMYQRMESELAALKERLEVETRHVTGGYSTSKSVSKEREAELKAAIATQRKKVLELRSERDQLAVLQRDVDAAKSAYDAVTARYNQTSLESQVTQANISLLSPAVEPLEPTSPNIPRNMLMAVLAGILLGGAAAWLLEMLDRRIRSAQDLAETLQLPVLGVIEEPRQSRLAFWQSRLAFWRQALLTAPK